MILLEEKNQIFTLNKGGEKSLNLNMKNILKCRSQLWNLTNKTEITFFIELKSKTQSIQIH